jgi:hypothetical protein
MTDIQSAAERYRGYSDFCKTEHDKGFNGIVMPYRGVTADAIVLADAYLAEHPADDGEAITEDWLRSIEHDLQSVGFEFHVCRNQTTDEWEPHHFSIEHRPDDGEGPIFIPCKMVTTRGDLRLLCRALGIPLPSPPEAGE